MDNTIRNFTIAWIGGVPIAIINAAIRNYIILPHTNELLAHQISSFTVILFLAAYLWTLNQRWNLKSERQAAEIGVIWLILTIIFEFLFGHYVVGHTWTHLLADYNIFAGKLWSLVLLWITVGPYIIYRVGQK